MALEAADPDSTFAERQSLPSWVGPLLLVLSIPPLALVVAVSFEDGVTLESAVTVVAIALLVVGPIPLVRRSELQTEVRSDGVAFRFAPIHRSERVVPFDEIESVRLGERRAYQSGLRRTRWGWEYRPNSSEGVEIYRRDGPPIFLGSERPHELRTAIEEAMRRMGSE